MKIKKLLCMFMAAMMLLGLSGVAALAAERTTPYANDTVNTESLPEGPDMTGDIIYVTPENAQYTLDGAYGAIDGKTIHFSSGEYKDVLVLARPTKYAGSNTVYYNMTWDTTNGWVRDEEPSDYEELSSNIRTYTRAVKNVTFTADSGVSLPGFTATSGHIYSTASNSNYDYVMDRDITTSVNSYHGDYTLENITFQNLVISGKVLFEAQYTDTVTKNITFDGCQFIGDDAQMGTGTYQAIAMKSDNNQFENIIISDCAFSDYFQGIYIQSPNSAAVEGCTFTNTTHNAIALQVNANGALRIQNNTFTDIADRAIRFGAIQEGASVAISGNTATNAGDGDGEILKADSISNSIQNDPTTLIYGNDWGGAFVEANSSALDDADAKIENTYYKTIAGALGAAQNDDNVIVAKHAAAISETLTIPETVTLTIPADSTVTVADGVTLTNNGTLVINGGLYAALQNDTDDPKADGKTVTIAGDGAVVVGVDGFADIAGTTSVEVLFDQVSEEAYDIVLAAADGGIINRLLAVDLTFTNSNAEVSYTIAPANNVNLIDVGNGRYAFYFDGVNAADATGTSVQIGTVTFAGVGAGTFGVDTSVTTNIANAAQSANNIVYQYVPDGGANAGVLVLDNDIDYDRKMATNTLTVNVTFPNNIADNAAAYQDMKATISGGDLAEDIVVNFGSDDDVALVDNAYTFTQELTENTTYTVTISGAGYRTTRYSVNMAEDKELTFWNNVMDEAQVIETGKDTSAVKTNFLAGDIVADNNINIYDLSAVVSYFGTVNVTDAASQYAKYDLNRDGVIDSKDVALVLVSWGN